LEEQKRKKKTEMRRNGFSDKNNNSDSTSLLVKIQDDLQSEISRYTAELDAACRPVSRSVVCKEDPLTSPEAGNIINTAIIDSRVSDGHVIFN